MGQAISDTLSQAYPPPSTFSPASIPSLRGKVVIVTGANTGIGKETVRALLNRDAKVYLAARCERKAREAICELKRETGREALFLRLDLADLKSIKKSAEVFLSQESKLHLLFNNAGVWRPPPELLTADGYDLQFGTNCLGHFYLTKLLLPTLIQTTRSELASPSTGANPKTRYARVITTSSWTHLWHRDDKVEGYVDPRMFRDEDEFGNKSGREGLGRDALYAQSKFGDILFAKELARRYEKDLVSIAVNPGNLKTDLQRHTIVPRWVKSLIDFIMLYPAELGALTQLWAGTAEKTVEYNGQYLIPWARLGRAHPATDDREAARKLWEYMEEQVQDL